MKKGILHFTTIAIILFLGSCSNEELFIENDKDPSTVTNTEGERTISLTASMPDDSYDNPSTRVNLTQERDKSIELTWEASDELELVFVQGDTKIKSTAKVMGIFNNGKKVQFDIVLPDEIKPGAFDLYGVYGGGGLSDANPTIIKLPENAGNAISLSSVKERKDLVLYFASKDMDLAEGHASVMFQHLGSLFNITLKNTSAASIDNLSEARLVGVGGEGKWAYNIGEGGGTYDLVSGEFQNKETAGNYISFKAAINSLPSGETMTFWGWCPPLPNVVWPELNLELRDATNALLSTSIKTRPAKTTPTAAGNSYYLSAEWDGTQLKFIESFDHPFLIVTKDMFPALRERSLEQPWKSMKGNAIARTKTPLKAGSAAFAINEYIGAAALAYILDEGNSQSHANLVFTTIRDHYSQLLVDEVASWGGIVPPLGAFFVATLALDIVYDALTESEIALCENIISSKIVLANRDGSWADARRGTHGTWDIYKGYRTTPDNDYYDGIMFQITPDGVSPVTNTYGWARVGGSNNEVSKSAYMDVLEFTGIDKRYYNNERIIKFQRWLYGSSVDCAKNYVIFGDMLANLTKRMPSIINWRIVNYDHEAAQYAAWLFKGTSPTGHILSYILPKSALPEPKVPSSQIYENGGAFLRDKEDDPKGLQITLYNIKSQDEYHTHNEVNGLSLSGLNNRLLVNGGRLGDPVRDAFLNNTLTINGKNHSSRLGGGILEGFLSDGIDYAVGSAGPALPSASHLRSSILVHSTTTVPGYFIVFDEVSAKSGDQVKNYLHPANQTNIVTVKALTEYTAMINHYPTVKNTSACFYYLTPPKAVNIEKFLSADPERYPIYPLHNRLESVYDVNSNGKKNLTTIVYPFSASLSKPTFQKIGNADFNACKIPHGNATDYVFESVSETQIEFEDLKVNADFCLIRKVSNQIPFYLVKNGLSFSSNSIGFQSSDKVTVYANGNKGTIISQGAKVKLTGAGMGSVKFTPAVGVISSGANFIEVQLGKGTYSFK